MAEPTALRLHDNQPFQDQLGHAVGPTSFGSSDDGTSIGVNANLNGSSPD
eukprot:CAMPEP_0198305924 /NCGR_PEP_ID=MMETSP1449-20131203/58157_1 /TAXON_ID=420275 /ORGANISM="Attheya septentrionalis, Strain CCMP2084" /LENGTH=49 /DNA_ID=CAMNT_0044008469 /DNA_START=108 /DNA_END=257 /DNA_ORIENTATION=-